MKKFACAFAVAAAFLAPSMAGATVINFNSGLDAYFTYQSIATIGNVYANSGYDNMNAYTGGGNSVFNPNGVSNASFLKSAGGTFTLNSLLVDGAWGSQTLTFVGLSSGSTLFSKTFGVSTAPSLVNFNWAGINELRVLTGNDFVQNASLGGSGKHWVIDNITVNENRVPEPASIALMGLAALGVFASRKKFGAK